MRRPFSLAAVASISCVAVFACSSGSGSASGGGGACADYVNALREGAQSCGKYNVAPGRDAELSARLEQECTAALNAPGTGITPSLLAQCAGKVRAACGDDDSCDDIVITGSLADGAPCGADAQCAGGDCKTVSTSASASRCGTCASRAAIGAACGGSNPGCVKGATCDTGTCVERVVLAEGDVCYDPAKPSSSPASCGDGLACKIEGAPSTQVKCTTRAAAGAKCTSESDCLSELVCLGGTCAVPGPPGTACTSSSQCANGACSTASKTCVAIQWVAAGGACDNTERRCARGSCAMQTPVDTETLVDLHRHDDRRGQVHRPAARRRGVHDRIVVHGRAVRPLCQLHRGHLPDLRSVDLQVT